MPGQSAPNLCLSDGVAGRFRRAGPQPCHAGLPANLPAGLPPGFPGRFPEGLPAGFPGCLAPVWPLPFFGGAAGTAAGVASASGLRLSAFWVLSQRFLTRGAAGASAEASAGAGRGRLAGAGRGVLGARGAGRRSAVASGVGSPSSRRISSPGSISSRSPNNGASATAIWTWVRVSRTRIAPMESRVMPPASQILGRSQRASARPV